MWHNQNISEVMVDERSKRVIKKCEIVFDVFVSDSKLKFFIGGPSVPLF